VLDEKGHIGKKIIVCRYCGEIKSNWFSPCKFKKQSIEKVKKNKTAGVKK